MVSGFCRVQEGARILKHSVRKSRRDENSNLKYNGKTVRKKDELHLVDCNVTGSDSGTSDAPKYACWISFVFSFSRKSIGWSDLEASTKATYPSCKVIMMDPMKKPPMMGYWLLRGARVVLGATGAADAPHEQSRSRCLSVHVQDAQQSSFKAVLEQDCAS